MGICQSSMQDPFSDTYCGDLYAECSACKGAYSDTMSSICSQFMGYGGCIEGIQAKTKEIEGCIAGAAEYKGFQRDQQKKKVEDAAGMDIFDLHLSEKKSVAAAGEGAEGTLPSGGTYSMDCIQDCSEHKALCAFDYGCDRSLKKLQTEVGNVKMFFDMYKMKHSEWQSQYDGLCPKY